MITTAIVAAGFATLGLSFLAMKFGKTFVKRLLGYDWAVDLMATVLITWMFATGGTISGMMTGIITGVFVSALLLVAKRIIGYQKLQHQERARFTWQDHPGSWQRPRTDDFSIDEAMTVATY